MFQLLRQERGDAGAAAVEFALLFPIFMVLALGIIAGGTAFSRDINLTQAAREASRFGATVGGATTAPAAWLDKVDDGLQQVAGNAADPLGGYDTRCVAYVETDASGSPASASFHRLNGAVVTPPSAGACPGAPVGHLKSARFVQVVLVRPTSFFVLFTSASVQIDAVSTTPYEGTAA